MQRLPRSCCRGTGSQTASAAACNFSWGQEGCVLKFPIVPAPSVPGPLQAITRPDRYWQQARGTTCKLEINPFDSLLCGQAAPSSCTEEKAPSQPWGRRNCPVWAFRQRFTLCGHMVGGTLQLSLLTDTLLTYSWKYHHAQPQKLKQHPLLCFWALFLLFFNMQGRKEWGKRNGCMKMAFTVSYKYTGLTSLWISNQGRFKGHR